MAGIRPPAELPGPGEVPGNGLPPRTTVSPVVADILLVADLPWVTDAVRAALADTAADLTVATDPAAATVLALEKGAEVVLVDLQVGSMGGMAVARALRAAARIAGTTPPAVGLLLDRDADAFLAGRSGAGGWIRKPFTAVELRGLVERLNGLRPQGPAES
jgi:DNA-binding response OmpR family regulator